MSTVVVFFSKDVFFWPVVKGAAQQIGATLVIVANSADSKLDNLEADTVRCCLIDLAATEAEKLPQVIQELKRKFPDSRIVAFGSHVQESRLALASEAGCDLVISRGKFTADVAAHLQQWVCESDQV